MSECSDEPPEKPQSGHHETKTKQDKCAGLLPRPSYITKGPLEKEGPSKLSYWVPEQIDSKACRVAEGNYDLKINHMTVCTKDRCHKEASV